VRLRHDLPDLYEAMAKLLRQDPYKVLVSRLAAA